MSKFLRVLFFSFFSFAVFAQNPSLSIIRVNSQNYCLGTELSIDVDVKGSFPAGNKFTVVAFRNWNDPSQRWEYPAELKGDKLVTVLREPALANSQGFALKVLSSNPQTEVDGNGLFRVFTRGSVVLRSRWGLVADTINATDQLSLTVIASPSSPGKVTLNTGDTFDLQYPWDWTAPYPTVITLPKAKPGTYSIREASNVCGPLSKSGEVNIKVNAVDLIPVAVSPQQPCIGDEIKVKFSMDGAGFDANTKFSIRFSSDNSYIDSYKYVDVPATLTGKNELKARVPENLNEMSNPGIYLGIVTENPSSVSITKALKIYVYPKPTVTLIAEKTAINLGESIYLSGNPTGMYPFKITLTSGEVMSNSTTISPEKTTTYQAKSLESGCGVTENPPHTPVTVTVKPSLLLSPAYIGNPRVACEGQTVRIAFKANGVNAQTTYSLESRTYSEKSIVFPAKVVGDSLEFFIPKNTSQDRDLDYGEITGVRVVSANPALSSPLTGFRIQSPPTMAWADYSQQSVQFPSAIRLDFDLRGGNPYTIEQADGTKSTYDYRNIWFQQFVRRDTTFRLAKLSNACFTNTDLPAFPIKVANPAGTTPNVFVKWVKKPICVGDSVEVELAFNGQFEVGNEFSLSYLSNIQSTTFTIRNVTRQGIHKIKLPVWTDGGYDATFQLSSSLPRLVSETERVYVGLPPRQPMLSPTATQQYPEKMYLGQSPNVTVYGSAYGPAVYSIDGIEGKIIGDHNGMSRVPLPLQNGKTTEFKLNSVTNTCGVWNGEITSYFYGIAYKIIINPPVYRNWLCAGSEAEVRFSFENGNAARGTKFTLQISPSGDTGSFTDVASVTDDQVFRFITPDVKAGMYYIRIYSSDNIYSDNGYINIGQSPTATLKTGYPTYGLNSATVDYGTAVHMVGEITGNTPLGIIYSDGEQQQLTDSYSSYSPVITGPQTFTITKVWNSCGYGTASGSVEVKVRPILEISKFPANADPSICPGQTIELDYAIRGADTPANAYLVFSISSDKSGTIKLDSVNTATGRIRLTIPGNMAGDRFFISAEIASLALSKSVFYQLYATPDMTLIGNNVITAGETTLLYVRSNTTFTHNTAFELSDGSSYVNNASYPGGVMQIKVSPTVTTTYTIKPLQSVCGAGKVSGSATITVQPKLAQSLSVYRVEGLRRWNVCNSDTIRVDFYHNRSEGNIADYEVLLSDSTGKNFVSLPTFGNNSPIKAIIPAGIKKSGFYRLRLTSKDPKVSGSTYAETLKIGERARAKLLTPSIYYEAGKSVNIVVGLEGSSPFDYRFGDDNFFRYRYATKYSDTITLAPLTPLASYKISQLNNECGPGMIDEPSALRIELITATEPASEVVSFGPNPTAGSLVLRFTDGAPRNLEILNAAGQKIFSGKYTARDATVDLSAFPAGTYLLQVTKKQNVTTYRVVKY
jgi:hypothetical protein